MPDLTTYRHRLSRSALVLAAFIAVVSVGSAALFRTRSSTPVAPVPAPSDAVAVSVSHVIDGDTLDVRSAETTIRVRLYGVDTPERGEACYDEATRRLTALAADRVLLVLDARSTDPYGRELRYVFTGDGRSVDALLVTEGLAHAWRQDGSRREALITLEDHARTSKTGCLWSGR